MSTFTEFKFNLGQIVKDDEGTVLKVTSRYRWESEHLEATFYGATDVYGVERDYLEDTITPYECGSGDFEENMQELALILETDYDNLVKLNEGYKDDFIRIPPAETIKSKELDTMTKVSDYIAACDLDNRHVYVDVPFDVKETKF